MTGIKEVVSDWDYDVVTIGYPGPVLDGRPLRDPLNLGAAGFSSFLRVHSAGRSKSST